MEFSSDAPFSLDLACSGIRTFISSGFGCGVFLAYHGPNGVLCGAFGH